MVDLPNLVICLIILIQQIVSYIMQLFLFPYLQKFQRFTIYFFHQIHKLFIENVSLNCLQCNMVHI